MNGPSRNTTGTRSGLYVASCILAVALLVPAALRAQPVIYHSPADDGVNPGGVPILASSGPEWLYIYLDSGTTSTATGTACLDGDGEEACGWNIQLEALDAVFLDFQPTGDVVSSLAAELFRANGLSFQSPSVAPLRLGQLQVQSSNVIDGSIAISVGSAVLANLESSSISTGTIAVVPAPEPGQLVVLGTGIVMLAGLSRLRIAKHTGTRIGVVG